MVSAVENQMPKSVAPYLDFVNMFVDAFEVGRTLPVGGLRTGGPELPQPTVRHKAILCSPHPDDEALVGGLALRLRPEAAVSVLNCAVTLGSDLAERKRRLQELESSCGVLGFHLLVPNHPNGLEDVRTEVRKTWGHYVLPATTRFWFYGLAMGVIWTSGVILYGRGAARIGQLGSVIGWPLFMATQIVTSGVWGFLTGEWKGSSVQSLQY